MTSQSVDSGENTDSGGCFGCFFGNGNRVDDIDRDDLKTSQKVQNSPIEKTDTTKDSEDIIARHNTKKKLTGSSRDKEAARVKVWIRNSRGDAFKPAKFRNCLVDHFAKADPRNIYVPPPAEEQVLSSTKESEDNHGKDKKSKLKNSRTDEVENKTDPVTSNPKNNKKNAITVCVECILQDNRILIQPAAHDEHPERGHSKMRKQTVRGPVSYITTLEHPTFCSANNLNPESNKTLSDDLMRRGVDVGVAALIESSDHKILVTRRASHMRSFPGVWVPPGGHIESGETIIQAAVREIKEEVGLTFETTLVNNTIKLQTSEEYNEDEELESTDEFTNTFSILGLWESCFPPVMYVGDPIRQHLVYYILIKVSQTAATIQKNLKSNVDEVEAIMWLDLDLVQTVIYSSKNVTKKTVMITSVDKNTGEFTESSIDSRILKRKMPEPNKETERLTTGTRFALEIWLQLREEVEEEKKNAEKMKEILDEKKRAEMMIEENTNEEDELKGEDKEEEEKKDIASDIEETDKNEGDENNI